MINPNRSWERMFLHFMSFIPFSVRFRSFAGILFVGLFYRRPLRLQQTDCQSARQSNDTDLESNDRFGFDRNPGIFPTEGPLIRNYSRCFYEHYTKGRIPLMVFLCYATWLVCATCCHTSLPALYPQKHWMTQSWIIRACGFSQKPSEVTGACCPKGHAPVGWTLGRRSSSAFNSLLLFQQIANFAQQLFFVRRFCRSFGRSFFLLWNLVDGFYD